MEWNRFDDESKELTGEGYYLVAAQQGEKGEHIWFDISFKYIAFPEDDIPKITNYFTHWMEIKQPTI